MADPDLPVLLFHAPGREFVRPYVERMLSGWKVAGLEDAGHADAAVMLSGCEVYAATEGEGLDESTPADGRLPLARQEVEFRQKAANATDKYLILRCANTIGTGMGGYGMKMARRIASGYFLHFPGNEARVSLIHAQAIAECTAALLEKMNFAPGGVYNLTDGREHKVSDLADALARRINDKKIPTLSTRPQQWLGKLLLRSLWRDYSRTITFSSGKAAGELGLRPFDTLEYMRTHIYDENSL